MGIGIRTFRPDRRTILRLACTAFTGLAVSAAQAFPLVMMPDSTNNRMVSFDPFDGSLVNSNVFGLAGGTPVHAMQVGSEIWVSEQIGDRVSRWDLNGAALGAITGGLDNVRGMALINNTVYVTNDGTANGAPGAALRMYDTSGGAQGFFATPNSSPFHVLNYRNSLLVASDAANDDIHRYSYAGGSLGTFHNSTSLNFAEQMTYGTDGHILVAAFSSNVIARLDNDNGAILGTYTASGARGVYQLGNGNILWSNGSGAHVIDVNTGGSTQVYTGGGRFFDLVVPEPSTLGLLSLSGLLMVMRRRG